MFAGKKSAQIREILISESAWEEMTCLFAPSKAPDGLTAVKNLAEAFEHYNEWHPHSALGYLRRRTSHGLSDKKCMEI